MMLMLFGYGESSLARKNSIQHFIGNRVRRSLFGVY
jgi:hypothetical protein